MERGFAGMKLSGSPSRYGFSRVSMVSAAIITTNPAISFREK